jgi:hypothetical protein
VVPVTVTGFDGVVFSFFPPHVTRKSELPATLMSQFQKQDALSRLDVPYQLELVWHQKQTKKLMRFGSALISSPDVLHTQYSNASPPPPTVE